MRRETGLVVRLQHRSFLVVGLAVLALLISCSAHTPSAESRGTEYKVKGKVVEVNFEKGRIKIDHEKIEGFMDAMTMWFHTKDPAILEGLAPGDAVEFTILDAETELLLTEIHKI